MTIFQQTPAFFDVCKPSFYGVRQPPNDFVQITVAGSSVSGSITFKPQCYFMATAATVFTNYDNVAPVVRTANSNAILGLPSTPNNFTVKFDRGNNNKYSNLPMPQALICSTGYRAGKVFPYPVVYGPRTNILFDFQDTTGLFLLTATSGGTAVPLTIKMFLTGFDIPVSKWQKFVLLYPEYANVFGAP